MTERRRNFVAREAPRGWRLREGEERRTPAGDARAREMAYLPKEESAISPIFAKKGKKSEFKRNSRNQKKILKFSGCFTVRSS